MQEDSSKRSPLRYTDGRGYVQMNAKSWLIRPLEGISAEKITGSYQDCNVTNVSGCRRLGTVPLLTVETTVVIPTRGLGARNLLCRCRQEADSSLRSE